MKLRSHRHGPLVPEWLVQMNTLCEQFKTLAAKHDIVIMTAKQAPRLHTFNYPLPTSDVMIIDYINLLGPPCASIPS